MRAGIYRDGGTGFALLEDASGNQYQLCFDKFLHRLCWGGLHTDEEAVVFVKRGSSLAHEIIATLKKAEPHLLEVMSSFLDDTEFWAT